MEALQQFRDWERVQIRDCNYRNHGIFTLRCITKELVPVSIKLKTTIKTEKARKIIRKAERDLLKGRVKSINSLLGYNAKQRDLCRSQLASLSWRSTMNKCQELIDKVSEFRYIKVRERQINKFNRLLQKGRKYNLVSPCNGPSSCWAGTPLPNLSVLPHRQLIPIILLVLPSRQSGYS